MRIHAIQTGTVKIKSAQVEGRGHGIMRQLAIFTDRNWAGWMPTYSWAIEHPEGVIVVDTGQAMHLLENVRSWHPFFRWEAAFRLEPEQEVGPQLRALGIGPRDVKKVVLTHMHVDHDAGLRIFRTAKSWSHPANFARQADGPVALADISRNGGLHGLIPRRSIWRQSRLVHSRAADG